jgi:hypothetical protein
MLSMQKETEKMMAEFNKSIEKSKIKQPNKELREQSSAIMNKLQ